VHHLLECEAVKTFRSSYLNLQDLITSDARTRQFACCLHFDCVDVGSIWGEFYRTTRHHIPDDITLNSHGCENPISRMFRTDFIGCPVSFLRPKIWLEFVHNSCHSVYSSCSFVDGGMLQNSITNIQNWCFSKNKTNMSVYWNGPRLISVVLHEFPLILYLYNI
jgi:hypothetical protein